MKRKSRRQTGGFPGPYRFGLPADLPDLGSALFVDAGHQYEAEIDSFNLPPAFWPEQWNIENYQKVLI